VLAHHAFTGIFQKDPDTVHVKDLLRKVPSSKHRPYMRNQHRYFWIVMMFLPNQHVGQAILYQVARRSKKLFGLRLEPFPRQIEWMVPFNRALRMVSVLVHLVLPFVLLSPWTALATIFVQWSAMGASYWACVAPNHDTLKTHNATKDPLTERLDWGEVQVRSSADHSCSSGVVHRAMAALYGGMNFQIEHHLFPSVSHVHYRKLHKIVKRTCKDFDIPLPEYSTWRRAMVGYKDLLALMSISPEKAGGKAGRQPE
jgi:linoleoyl-CoA desaturase